MVIALDIQIELNDAVNGFCGVLMVFPQLRELSALDRNQKHGYLRVPDNFLCNAS